MKIKRIAALGATLLMVATAAGSLTACGGGAGTIGGGTTGGGSDSTKANLYVGTYDGGVGKAWLEEAAARFMELHKDSTHFQEGRTGVKVHVDGDKVKYSGTQLSTGALTKDVYFTEAVEYYTFVNSGKVADITDVITNPAGYGETATIESKLDDSFKSYMTAGTDGKYYMVPFYDGLYGIMYDIDLFEEVGFYYDQDGDFLRLLPNGDRATFEANKSNGPDGVKGTYDDGLPATYAEFIALADYMKTKNVVPFCYSGAYNDYVSKVFRSFIADYEGYDAFNLNYTFNGTATLVKSVNADGSIETEEVVITEDNAYELQKQAGKYYALKMQEELFGSVEYIGNKYNTFDFTVAQLEFVKSKYTKTRYAMLLDGVWWENEADGVFKDLEALRGEKKSDRHFGFLPIPKVDESSLGGQTLLSANSSFGFVNAKSTNMELAKEFMRFLHTDAEMAKFTAKTSIPRSFNYTIGEDIKETATSFGQSVIDLKNNSQIVYPYSALPIIVNNMASFTETKWFMTSSVGGATLENPFTAFEKGSANALQYFNGLYTYQKNAWKLLKR